MLAFMGFAILFSTTCSFSSLMFEAVRVGRSSASGSTFLKSIVIPTRSSSIIFLCFSGIVS